MSTQTETKNKHIAGVFIILALIALGLIQDAVAAKNTAPAPKADKGPKEVRSKNIEFEGKFFEGLPGKNYDSLSQTGKVDENVNERLYRIRTNYDDDTSNLFHEMEYLK